MNNFHTTLRKYRVLQWVTTVFLMWLTLDVWGYIESNLKEVTEWQVAVLATAFSSLIAGLFSVLKNANEKQEKDTH